MRQRAAPTARSRRQPLLQPVRQCVMLFEPRWRSRTALRLRPAERFRGSQGSLVYQRRNKLPSTCNKQDATRKGAIKVATADHEGIMQEAEQRDRLEYDDSDGESESESELESEPESSGTDE
uniref:Uncharacterized protein n=1 Tax=Coccolithus braarudii TaxID=221442 RepID=A0A7S0Q0Y9_9EUKA|mmetsp:Transcript_30302/g.65147  ORF Transcript_30302/g.65147 Transcript_30302/m.65147 type:complete len:122 (+) Transcript_30302:389-754(+)